LRPSSIFKPLLPVLAAAAANCTYFLKNRKTALRSSAFWPNFCLGSVLCRPGWLSGGSDQTMTSPLEQKIRIKGPVVITANRLADGAVVHRTKSGEWTRELTGAEILWNVTEVQSALKAAHRQGLEAVGAYAAPIDASQANAQPGNLREVIRTKGPTFTLPSDEVRQAAA
jgi:hypothetical protein